jgi:hypothetical protein
VAQIGHGEESTILSEHRGMGRSLGTIWGPHVIRDLERRTRRSTSRNTMTPCLTCPNGYFNVLGVKGSQVRILSARRSSRSPLSRLFRQLRGLPSFPKRILLKIYTARSLGPIWDPSHDDWC